MRVRILISGVLCLLVLVTLTEAEESALQHEQTTCPVMEGMPIDKSIHVDYKRKRVYFCCKLCFDSFKRSPEKYLSKLSQFKIKAAMEHDKEHSHKENYGAEEMVSSGDGFQVYRLVRPLGIATLISLVLTLIAGLLRQKLRWRFFAIHRFLAFLTLALAILHLSAVLLFH